MEWERTTLKPLDFPDDAPGERLTLINGRGDRVATIVRWPGTLYRVFWMNGGHADFATRAAAVQAVEDKAGFSARLDQARI